MWEEPNDSNPTLETLWGFSSYKTSNEWRTTLTRECTCLEPRADDRGPLGWKQTAGGLRAIRRRWASFREQRGHPVLSKRGVTWQYQYFKKRNLVVLCFWVDCRQWKWIWQRQKDPKERGSEIQPRAEGANGRVGTVGIGREDERWVSSLYADPAAKRAAGRTAGNSSVAQCAAKVVLRLWNVTQQPY